jgi:hypothetical protein
MFPGGQRRGIGRCGLEVMRRLVVEDEQRPTVLGVNTVEQWPESADGECQHKQPR